MILVDAHVHIYDCFDLGKFFDSAYANFKAAAEQLDHGSDFAGILFLAETSKENWFQRLIDYADGKDSLKEKATGSWTFHRTDENDSLFAKGEDLKSLFLIAGRQIETEENIEVLALCTSDDFNDGKPILDLIREIKKKDGLIVIPWGVGKWAVSRGKVIRSLLIKGTERLSAHIGDNGNRPFFWPRPSLFKLAEDKGILNLPGSDPLPFAEECFKVGSFGFSLESSLHYQRPATDLKSLILNPSIKFKRYGRSERLIPFFKNQLRLRFKT